MHMLNSFEIIPTRLYPTAPQHKFLKASFSSGFNRMPQLCGKPADAERSMKHKLPPDWWGVSGTRAAPTDYTNLADTCL